MTCVMVENDPSGQTEAGHRGTGEGGGREGGVPCGGDREGIRACCAGRRLVRTADGLADGAAFLGRLLLEAGHRHVS